MSWSGARGSRPVTSPGSSDELDSLGRLPVDRRLRALPDVFVAGDTAAAACDAEHTVMRACRHAAPLGKVAGYNAAADLLDVPLRDFTPGPYVTCLDLGGAGAVVTREAEGSGSARHMVAPTGRHPDRRATAVCD